MPWPKLPKSSALGATATILGDDDWPDWETLHYVASHVYERLVGRDDDCGDAFYHAVEAEAGDGVPSREVSGGTWTARTAAKILPRMSIMFPLRPIAEKRSVQS